MGLFRKSICSLRQQALLAAFGLSICSAAIAADPAATIVLMTGQVFKQGPGEKSPSTAKRGDRLPSGTVVTTKDKSFAKLLFNDNSQMNVGPSSEMKIEQYQKGQPGLIKLIDGSIRAKITKELIRTPSSGEPQNKLLLRTKTAALGVRGTDFQVSYNDKNGATALVTFESQVAMARFEASGESRSLAEVQNQMAEVLRSDAAVLVSEGQFSAASRSQEQATPAVTISPEQLESLKKNETMTPAAAAGSEAAAAAKTNYVSPVPPGVDATKFAAGADLSKALEKTLGAAAMQEVAQKVQAAELATKAPTANADVAGAQLAGGYVDLSRGVYVAPDPKAGAIFDPVTKMFTPDPSVRVGGGGELKLASNVAITDSGEIRKVDPNTGVLLPPGPAVSPEMMASRLPASEGTRLPPPELDQNRLEEQDEQQRLSDLPPPQPGVTDTAVSFQITTSP
jgi:hypothetical protein